MTLKKHPEVMTIFYQISILRTCTRVYRLHTWNPNDLCFACKRPSFGGFNPPKQRTKRFQVDIHVPLKLIWLLLGRAITNRRALGLKYGRQFFLARKDHLFQFFVVYPPPPQKKRKHSEFAHVYEFFFSARYLDRAPFTLAETNSPHLKIDAWNTRFLLGPCLVSGAKS